jgi:hypothetical protein
MVGIIAGAVVVIALIFVAGWCYTLHKDFEGKPEVIAAKAAADAAREKTRCPTCHRLPPE